LYSFSLLRQFLENAYNIYLYFFKESYCCIAAFIRCLKINTIYIFMISPSKGYFSKEWYNILWFGQIFIFYILWSFFLINSFDALIIFIFLSKVTAVSLYLFRFIKEDTMYFIVNELYLCVLHPNLIEYTVATKSQNADTKCVYYIFLLWKVIAEIAEFILVNALNCRLLHQHCRSVHSLYI